MVGLCINRFITTEDFSTQARYFIPTKLYIHSFILCSLRGTGENAREYLTSKSPFNLRKLDQLNAEVRDLPVEGNVTFMHHLPSKGVTAQHICPRWKLKETMTPFFYQTHMRTSQVRFSIGHINKLQFSGI